MELKMCKGFIQNYDGRDLVLILRSYLKNMILVQDQGEAKFEPADIREYFEELKRGSNAGIGPKDIFEIASI